MIGASAALVKLTACTSRRGDGTFSAEQLAMLNGFADVVIPHDDQPGGADLGAAAYIDRLIHAFDATPDDPAAIYAGGPYSGRQPYPDATGAPTAMFPDDDFETFVELDRVNDTAWRLTVQGSSGVPGGAPNEALLGAVVGIKDQLTTGLDAALARTTTSVYAMSAAEFQAQFDGSDPDFQDLFVDLVVQAAFAAPEYGGNPSESGWKMIHFEGDSLPMGYSQWNGSAYVERPESPLTTANASDPEPLTDDVRQILGLVAAFLGGQSF